jgi:hypothetical protein
MSYLAAFLYLAGCLSAAQYADLLKYKNSPASFGFYAYVFAWPIVIPGIWFLALVTAVLK